MNKTVLFSCILVFLSLLLIEGLSAVGIMVLNSDGPLQIQHHDFHPLRKHVYPAHDQVRSDWPELKTDERGYIITPGAPENPDITVVLTGSSSARCTKPSPKAEHTLAALLQTELNENYGLNAEVINLAVAGYSSFHEFMTLYEYFEDYKDRADIVVSANGLYSIDGLARHLEKRISQDSNYSFYDKNMAKQVNAVMDGSFGGVMEALGKYILSFDLNTIQLLKRGIIWFEGKTKKSERKGKDAIDYRKDEKVRELYQNLLRREYEIYGFMNQTAKGRNAPYLLALLPARYTWAGTPPDVFEKKSFYDRRRWFVDKFYSDFLDRNPSYPVLDLRDSFDHLDQSNPPYSGKETVHYNPAGMQALAEKIAKSVVNILALQE